MAHQINRLTMPARDRARANCHHNGTGRRVEITIPSFVGERDRLLFTVACSLCLAIVSSESHLPANPGGDWMHSIDVIRPLPDVGRFETRTFSVRVSEED